MGDNRSDADSTVWPWKPSIASYGICIASERQIVRTANYSGGMEVEAYTFASSHRLVELICKSKSTQSLYYTDS